MVTFRRDNQNAEKPTFYDGIQLIHSHLYATIGVNSDIRSKSCEGGYGRELCEGVENKVV